MGFKDIVIILVFLLGSALQIAILVLMTKRKGQKGRESIFALLTFCVLGWTFGIFISHFCTYLYRETNIVQQIFGGVSIFSFTLVFPLLVNVLFNYYMGKFFYITKWVKNFLYISLYLPFIIFAYYLWQILYNSTNSNFFLLENFIANFIKWAFVLLIVAVYITIVSYLKAKEKEEKRWLYFFAWILSILIIAYLVCFILDIRKIAFIGTFLVLATEILTFFLPPILAYYIYSYNYMEYVIKRSIIYCFLGIVVISFYIFLIRPSGEMLEEKFNIDFKMVESILVMILVFFFNPVQRGLQEFFNRIFFRERQYYRKLFSDLSSSINRASYFDLKDLLDEAAQTISRSMKIREVSFIFFHDKDEKKCITESTLAISFEDIKNIVDYLEQNQLPILNIYELRDTNSDIVRELRDIKAFTVIPVYNNKKLTGILNVGKRLMRHRLFAEEEEMLTMLLNQVITAIDNTNLIRQKFLLERKMYENEKLSSLGRLSASIAHEVKNPLSSIKTITQVTKEELASDDPNQEGLNIIIEEINRLSRVVNKLLRFARPYSDRLEEIEINSVLKDVLLLLKHEAKRNQVTIKNNAFEEKNLFILSDRDALNEIFFNLIHNSIQALPEGGTVEIRQRVCKSYGNPSKLLKILISDNGPGIAPGDRPRIFEPFYTTKQNGTGLGLSIVKHRLKKLKGDISIKDNPNNIGVKFEIILPIIQADKVELPGYIKKTQ